MIYQLQFGLSQSQDFTLGLSEISLRNPLFYIFLDIVLLIILIVILFFLIKLFFREANILPVAFKKVIILVTLPREASKEYEEKINLELIREKIGVAETLFSNLGGMRAQRGPRTWLWGREDHFSLEIVAQKGLISFYIATPLYLKEYIQQQIQAQYPEANLEEVEDYNIFSPQGVVWGSYLKFSRPYIFPINTYKKLNSDPLNAITNALSRVALDDGIAIQIVARSAKKVWHHWGAKLAQEIQQGKTLSEALATTSSGLNLFKIFNFFSTKTSKKKEKEKQPEPRRLSPMEEEQIKGLEEKTSKAGLDCNIRIVVSALDQEGAKGYLSNILDSFAQFNYYQFGNSFKKASANLNRLVKDFIYRNFSNSKKVLLNTEELASIYHFPLPFTETPNIRWLLAKKLFAPANLPKEGLLLGENIYRGVKTDIYIKPDDRRRHIYIIGMTGTGKSTLIAELAKQDIKNGEGVCVIDPHGTLIENILSCIPKERIEDVVLFDPSDTERPVGLNMLEADTPEAKDFAIQEMIAIFYKLFPPEIIGPMFEHNMRNAMLTLMADREYPGTIAEIPRIFSDSDFQKYKVRKVTDPIVKAFWEKEMAKTTEFHKSEMLGYLISKVGRFVENAMMRNIIGQPYSGFNIREIMDKQKILLINLSKGKVGEVNSSLLGLIIVSKLQMAALARADLPEEQRKDFYLYIDEFQNFVTDSIATILSEARKYRLDLILAHQFVGQLVVGGDTRIRDAVFGNVGTIICFRIGVEDAEILAKQLVPLVSEYDLMNIEKFNAYIRLLVDNQATRAFNMHCFLPMLGDPEVATKIKELSRLKYGRPRQEVEAEILERSQLGSTSADLSSFGERSL